MKLSPNVSMCAYQNSVPLSHKCSGSKEGKGFSSRTQPRVQTTENIKDLTTCRKNNSPPVTGCKRSQVSEVTDHCADKHYLHSGLQERRYIIHDALCVGNTTCTHAGRKHTGAGIKIHTVMWSQHHSMKFPGNKQHHSPLQINNYGGQVMPQKVCVLGYNA